MKPNRYTFIYIGILVAGLSCQKGDIPTSIVCDYTPDSTHNQHPRGKVYQDIIDSFVANGLPGISVYIEDNHGDWAGAGGLADIKEGIHFLPCTVSKVASITKMMVGTLTMLMVEEGLFRLDDVIDPYIDAKVLQEVENARGATIRQLMQHTTGIYDIISDNGFYLDVLNDPDKYWTAENLIPYAYGQNANFPLGSSCLYSNTNTLLLSMVLEQATGRPHHQLLRERILEPLGMQDTYYYSHDKLPPYTAQGYYDLYNNGTLVNVTNFNTGSGNGYGGMFSTVFDIAKFLRAVVVEERFLLPESLTEMQHFIPEVDLEDPNNDLLLGAGLMKRYFNQEFGSANYGIGHTGRDLAYSANCFYFPTQETICCFIVNYGTNGESALREVFFEFQSAITDAVTSG